MLFLYLNGFKQRAEHFNTIKHNIGEIFDEIKSKFQSGYSLLDALEYTDELRFRSQQEKRELSELYEAKIRNMSNAVVTVVSTTPLVRCFDSGYKASDQ